MEPQWLRAARFVGVEPSAYQVEQMDRFGRWLLDEAIPAGGLGPGEADRVQSRHLADSIVFGVEFPEEVTTVADLGTGVGLPGIPLAIMYPDLDFTLIDRSGRRTNLARRATRILSLSNVVVHETDAHELDRSFDIIVARAFAPPPSLEKTLSRILKPGGVAIVGGSTRARPEYEGWRTREIPEDVLDHASWLLMMRPQ